MRTERSVKWAAMAALLLLVGCSTTGNLGMVTKSTVDSASILSTETRFSELGPVESEVCRQFLLAIIPWGASDFELAVDRALSTVGGDALIDVTVESGLYGFLPIYNIFSLTCTTVKGTAIKLE